MIEINKMRLMNLQGQKQSEIQDLINQLKTL